MIEKQIGKSSRFAQETTELQQAQRELEQRGHEGKAVVNRRNEVSADSGPPNASNQVKEHPLFKENQRFDGIDNIRDNPIYFSQEDRREYENELRLQHQKQLEKSNQNRLSSAPTMSRS